MMRLFRVHASHSLLCIGIALLTIGAGLGCANDTTGLAINPFAQQYWALHLNHEAITMALIAPYDTLQLVATPITPTGAPVADTGTVTYVNVNNDSSVTISPTGILTALKAVSNWMGVVRLTVGGATGVTLTDTVRVTVLDVASVPNSTNLTILPYPDSARDASDVYDVAPPFPSWIPIVEDGTGEQMIGLPVRMNDGAIGGSYWNNSGLVPFVFLNPVAGSYMIRAQATVYGKVLTDSLLYTFTAPLYKPVGVNPRTLAGQTSPLGYFVPVDDTIAVGGIVEWRIDSTFSGPIDVTFDDPTAVQGVDSATFMNSWYFADNCACGAIFVPNDGGGNIAPFKWVNADQGDTTFYTSGGVQQFFLPQLIGERARMFPKAGTYTYHSTLYGTTGVIHVLP